MQLFDLRSRRHEFIQGGIAAHNVADIAAGVWLLAQHGQYGEAGKRRESNDRESCDCENDGAERRRDVSSGNLYTRK